MLHFVLFSECDLFFSVAVNDLHQRTETLLQSHHAGEGGHFYHQTTTGCQSSSYTMGSCQAEGE